VSTIRKHLTIAAAVAVAALAVVALAVAPIVAHAATARPRPNSAPVHGTITCWESTQVTDVHGREVPFVTLAGTYRGLRELTCTLTPVFPAYLNHWALRAPGGGITDVAIVPVRITP
jgi:hypothetical protein